MSKDRFFSGGGQSEIDALQSDIHNWSAVTLSLTNTALNTENYTDVSGLSTAREAIIVVPNQSFQAHFYNVGNTEYIAINHFDNGNAAWEIAFQVRIKFSQGKVGLVTNLRGGNQPYPIVTTVYYR